MIIESEKQAKELLISEDFCYSLDKRGNIDFLLDAIKKSFPELAKEYSWLYR